jgi:hypothetical protein
MTIFEGDLTFLSWFDSTIHEFVFLIEVKGDS